MRPAHALSSKDGALHDVPRSVPLASKRQSAVKGMSVLRRTLSVQRLGDSLEVRLTSPGGAAGSAYCGIALGDLGPVGATPVLIPGLVEPLLMALPEEAFY